MRDPILKIAIDGPAAAGKGTLSKKIASHYQLAHMDTGLLYRAVGHLSLKAQKNLDDAAAVCMVAKSLTPQDLLVDELRRDHVAQAASKIAIHAPVRDALLLFQRSFAENPPKDKRGSVLDGRDIGTAILPDATHKFFIIASLEARAERRYLELKERNISCLFKEVLDDMKQRDFRDQNRSTAPLFPASDARILDTSNLSIDEAFRQVCAIINQ